MKKQIVFLVLSLVLAVPCLAQMKPTELKPDGKELSEDEQRILSLIAGVSSINTGENIRNDIVWRKKWIEQLKETEETFYKIINSALPPYTLYYSTAIETGKIDYQKETADLNISLNLLANAEWFTAMQRSLKAAQAVQNGLNAANRKKDWGLDEWPERGVSDTNPFASPKQHDISVEFELVNQQGILIGRQTAELNPSIGINKNFVVIFKTSESYALTFRKVNANDISDKLTIRLASVNGASPETVRFPIIAVSTKTFPEYQVSTKRTTFTDSRDGRKYKAVEIGPQTWMAEDLNFNAKGSECPLNKPANCQKYGRLYDWNTAMKACPKGWHLPSDAEWDILMISVGGKEIAGKYLKATSGWNINGDGNGTDKYGFSALPVGYSYGVGAHLYHDGSYGGWWSASEYFRYNMYDRKYVNDGAYYRYMDYYGEYAHYAHGNKYGLRSVRCVQDN